MATDLERFVDADGRDDKIAEVRRRIDAEGITYIYYQFVSVTGRIMGKGVPAPHWESIARKGFQLVYGSTANLFTDRHGDYIGYGPEAWELVGLPEVETFQAAVGPSARACSAPVPRPGGREGRRRLPDLGLPRQPEADPGRVRARTGLHLRVGTEPEMMWLKMKPDGTPDVEGMTKPYCYHIDQFSELQPIIHKVMEYGKAMGLDMIQGDHEDAPGQLELNWKFDRAEQTADRLTTYRQICRQVGRELDVFPCFMPKPFMGVSANGCHHNISLWQGDENMFLPDGDNPRMPSKIGLYAIGGMLEHLSALTASPRPPSTPTGGSGTPASGRRVFADWGFQNRTTALRVSAPGRFEYRSVDSAVNPYLSLAALIKAMDDGITRKLDPGQPEERNIYEAMAGGKEVKRIPMTFGDALDALDEDEVIRSALPGEMYKVFRHYKRDEWERYCATSPSGTSRSTWTSCRDRRGLDWAEPVTEAEGFASAAAGRLGGSLSGVGEADPPPYGDFSIGRACRPAVLSDSKRRWRSGIGR